MMKHFLMMLAVASCALALNATTYTGHLRVAINDEVAEQEQVEVEVTRGDNGYTLSLKNFVLTSDDVTLPVGNIVIEDVTGVDEYGYTTIKYNDKITITPGDDPNYSESEWLGPMLGDVVIDMTSRFTSTAMDTSIDIDLTAILGQEIHVNLFGIAPVIKGDVNEDTEVNVSDANAVIDLILK